MPNSRRNQPNKPIPGQQSDLVQVGVQELYAGPIPHPETLRQFGEVDPSFPERLMKMTEENNRADVTEKDRMSLVSLAVPVIGQIGSFLISAMGFGTAIFFGLKGIEGGAIAAALGGIAPIVIAALANLKK